MGLADKLGNLDFVAREVIKAEEVIDYTPRDNVAERLAKRFGAAIGRERGEGAARAAAAALMPGRLAVLSPGASRSCRNTCCPSRR
jgi:protease-4